MYLPISTGSMPARFQERNSPSEAKAPTATQLTRMPYLPHSAAFTRVNICSPALAALKAAPPRTPDTPAPEDTFRLRDELLNRELFTTLLEARVLLEQHRREHNEARPHSSLGYNKNQTVETVYYPSSGRSVRTGLRSCVMCNEPTTAESSKPAPVCIGILHDRPQPDGGEGFERIVRIGAREVAETRKLDRELEFIHANGLGLPMGTARAVEDAFASLVDQGALAIIGPAISDNGLIARDLADAARTPCINYTGGEQTRSEWMFHYQVGSLEDEPTVLARHIAARGLKSAALVHDRSPIGQRMASYFDEACASLAIDLVGRASISPVAEELSGVVAKLRATDPEALVYLGLGLSAYPLGQAVAQAAWEVPVVANSALMFGYAYPDWTKVWDGWVYVDAVAEDNRLLAHLQSQMGSKAPPGPGLAAAYDMGRLVAESVGRAVHLTREGLRDALETIKLLPATIGREGTTMGFGRWERSALKGEFLVLRQWRGGRTLEFED